jgi:putative membrane-bound dehydrogenase-like protein
MKAAHYLIPALLLIAVIACDQKKAHKAEGARKIEILFLGHGSEHHNSARYMPILAEALTREGINFTYTEDVNDLNDETLSYYDGVILYANHDSITTDQEKALLSFVESGGGFIPVHCASFCFRNSSRFVDLVGGQFAKHDTGVFTARIMQPAHAAMKDVKEFTTWDETYVHKKLTPDRTVLMERIEGEHHEPWTWVRDEGKGRVFYTASGHDERTWTNAGFQQMLKQGILWAVGDKVKSQWQEFRAAMPTLKYHDESTIPNYEKRDPAPKFQEPLSPEESQKLIQVPAGFDLELFASEPDIVNPISMEWDERGRLWVIETVDYPNDVRESDGVGDDRIKICEDTDGDGRADKFTIFAENLNIPTSLTFHNGGVIVSQAPHFLYLKDTDGDGKADERKVLIDGWGTFDTHAGPSNLHYGFDNMIYGSVGYAGFKGQIGGKLYEFNQGLYRFNPDASNFEFLTRTSNNTWGLGITENNDLFASTANNTHSVYVGIPDTYIKNVEGLDPKRSSSIKIDGHYAMHPITEKVRQVDVFGGFTAAAGHNFYTARNYPKRFWNSQVAFVCEPTGHLVHMANIRKDGAGFIEKDGFNIFASVDEWVSPVEAKVGPDGAVWILDWYDFIVQHNPTPSTERGGYEGMNGKGNAYENPLRDKQKGRVWRVVYKESQKPKLKQLDKNDPEELVEALRSDNLFWRLTAQRLLIETLNTQAIPNLIDLVKKSEADETGMNYPAIHALWTLQGLHAYHHNGEAVKLLASSLKNSNAGVRKAAIQIISTQRFAEDDVIKNELLQEKDPNTLLANLISLNNLPASNAIGKLLYELSTRDDVKSDNWLMRAIYAAAVHHREGFISAYKEANPNVSDKGPVQREAANFDATSWKEMAIPSAIEQAGLNIDGVIWFRKTITLQQSVRGQSKLSLGAIDDADKTWVNGVLVGSSEHSWQPRLYIIPGGVLKKGENTITVRVEDASGNGGLVGNRDQIFLESNGKKTDLTGNWKYDVEREYNSKNETVFGEASLAEVFMQNYALKDLIPTGQTQADAKDDNAIVIKVVKGEMKFDPKSITVKAGQPVHIVFENPDFMQHNFVIVKPGALAKVGRAADKLASDPKGSDMQYVPAMEEVLYHTKLVNPQSSEVLDFTAPSEPGDYPFVCTFPGHWSIMNGVMKVTKN